MKTKFLMLGAFVAALFTFSACEDEGLPLDKVISASMDFRNRYENIDYKQNAFGSDIAEYEKMPKSIEVPTGSMLRFSIYENLSEYLENDATISKVFIKTTVDGVDSECEMKIKSNLPDWRFPAYKNADYNIRVQLSTGEEISIGPFTVKVQTDNKVLTDKFIEQWSGVNDARGLIADEANSNAVAYFFAPNYMEGLSGGFGMFRKPGFATTDYINTDYSAQFGLFGISNKGVKANELKIVAADKVKDAGIHPTIMSQFGCGLGVHFARFEAWDAPLDTTQIDYFHAYLNTLNLDYAALGNIQLSNPQAELIITKERPCFKFETSYGKKGYGMLRFTENTGAFLQFIMQR